jgi:hypothetical protein
MQEIGPIFDRSEDFMNVGRLEQAEALVRPNDNPIGLRYNSAGISRCGHTGRLGDRRGSLSDSPFFAADELKAFGFSDVGDNIQVSRKCSFYRISGRTATTCGSMTSHLQGHVEIGSYVHVAAFCSVSGAFAKVS